MKTQKEYGLSYLKERLASYPYVNINNAIIRSIYNVMDNKSCDVDISATGLKISVGNLQHTITFLEEKEIKRIIIETTDTKRKSQETTRKEFLFEGEMVIVVNSSMNAKTTWPQKTPIMKAKQITTAYLDNYSLANPIFSKKTELCYNDNHDFSNNELQKAIITNSVFIKRDSTACGKQEFCNLADISVDTFSYHYTMDRVYCTPDAFPSRPKNTISLSCYRKKFEEWYSENPNIRNYTIASHIFNSTTEKYRQEFDEYTNRYKNIKRNFKKIS